MGGTLSGTVVVEPSILDAILANPAAFYVDVHTTEYPSSAIRGQLQTSTVPATSEVVLLLICLGLAITGALVLKR